MPISYVYRGGSWDLYSDFCRSAVRGRFSPADRSGCLGFRVLRSSKVTLRTSRGGSWKNDFGLCCSAFCGGSTPDYQDCHLGFRIIKDTDV